VATALTGRNGNQLFMAGGELRAHDGGAFGQEALDFVRQFRVTHAILSVAAIDEKDGFLLRDLREAEFSRAMMSRADQTTIAADATKYTTKAPIAIAPLTRFTRLVTDAAPPACVQAQLANSGVTLTIV
jgi:DeoR family glycerol-3-phosphate regulon repressor